MKHGKESVFPFALVDANGEPIVGATSIVSLISQDGGTFKTTTNNVAELGHGFYSLVLTAGEMTAGFLCLKVAADDAAPVMQAMVL